MQREKVKNRNKIMFSKKKVCVNKKSYDRTK